MEWSVECKPAYSLLRITLEPGEEVTSEAGAMLLFKGDVDIKTHTGGGLVKGLLRGVLGTESIFLNSYIARNRSELWLAPATPGDIHYIPLSGETYVVQDSSYLAHHGDIDIGVAWRGFRGLIAEGEVFWLRLEGNGGVWVNAYGGLEEIELADGESVTVDNLHFVAMKGDMDWRVRKFGGWKSFLLGGEGFVLEVKGPGKLLIQTRALPPFARLIAKFTPSRRSGGFRLGFGT